MRNAELDFSRLPSGFVAKKEGVYIIVSDGDKFCKKILQKYQNKYYITVRTE